MRCIIDDSESSIYSQTRRPDVIFLAGITIPETEINTLVNIYENIKDKYGLKGKPIKYNNDGIKDYYLQTIKKPELYEILKQNQKAIRNEIIQMSTGISYYIVVSWRMCSANSKKYNNQKQQNISNSFLDILNISLQFLPNFKNEQFEIILDRFPDKQQIILENELSNWKEERELELHNVCLSYQYGVTLQNPLLQITDIITGTFKDLIKDIILGKTRSSSSYNHLIPKLVGYPNKIAGAGLIGPPEQEEIIVNRIEESYQNAAMFSLLG